MAKRDKKLLVEPLPDTQPTPQELKEQQPFPAVHIEAPKPPAYRPTPDAVPQPPEQPQQPQQVEFDQRQEVQMPTEQQEASFLQRSREALRLGRKKKVLQDQDTEQVQVSSQSQVGTQQKTKTRQEIEAVLAEGLTEIYQTMTPQEQEQFRLKGEQAVQEIETMMSRLKATARKVLTIIRGWLSTIPRVNKFFLEQESKLKTDEIMKLQRKKKKQNRLGNFDMG